MKLNYFLDILDLTITKSHQKFNSKYTTPSDVINQPFSHKIDSTGFPALPSHEFETPLPWDKTVCGFITEINLFQHLTCVCVQYLMYRFKYKMSSPWDCLNISDLLSPLNRFYLPLSSFLSVRDENICTALLESLGTCWARTFGAGSCGPFCMRELWRRKSKKMAVKTVVP